MKNPKEPDDLARLFDAFAERNRNVSVMGLPLLERDVRALLDALKARIAELETAEAKRQHGYARLRESDAWKDIVDAAVKHLPELKEKTR